MCATKTLTDWLAGWIGYLVGTVSIEIEWGISYCFATNTSTYVRPITCRYCTNHIWTHIFIHLFIVCYLLFYPCCTCTAQLYILYVAMHIHTIYMSIGCCYENMCALFVANSKLIWLYVIFRSLFCVQNERNASNVVSWILLNWMENANEICITTFRFLHGCRWTEQMQIWSLVCYPFIHSIDDVNSSFI